MKQNKWRPDARPAESCGNSIIKLFFDEMTTYKIFWEEPYSYAIICEFGFEAERSQRLLHTQIELSLFN